MAQNRNTTTGRRTRKINRRVRQLHKRFEGQADNSQGSLIRRGGQWGIGIFSKPGEVAHVTVTRASYPGLTKPTPCIIDRAYSCRKAAKGALRCLIEKLEERECTVGDQVWMATIHEWFKARVSSKHGGIIIVSPEVGSVLRSKFEVKNVSQLPLPTVIV